MSNPFSWFFRLRMSAKVFEVRACDVFSVARMNHFHRGINFIGGDRVPTFDGWKNTIFRAIHRFDGVVTKLFHGYTSVVTQLNKSSSVVVFGNDRVNQSFFFDAIE